MKYTTLITALTIWLCSGALAQINSQPDSAFGAHGIAVTDLNNLGQNQYVHGAKTGPDGKYYVCGMQGNTGNFKVLAARFNTDGTLDTSFGASGAVYLDPLLGPYSTAHDMDIQPDGKILLGGYAKAPDSDVMIARLNTDGSLDTSFSSTGIFITGASGDEDILNGIKTLSTGKLIAVGTRYPTPPGPVGVVMRLNADGTPDATFGSGGATQLDLGNSSTYLLDVVEHAPNRYYVLGTVDGEETVIALSGTGTPVLTFGNNGKQVLTQIPIGVSFYSIQTTVDGKIWLAGDVQISGTFNAVFMRLNADGTPDSTFSGDGVFMEDMGDDNDDRFIDFYLQDDGQILLSGLYEVEPGA